MKGLIKPIFLLLVITVYGKDYEGAEIRTTESFTYGRFEVNMQSAQSSGVVNSFFTFYDSPDFADNWNEIDIEILGKYTDDIQFNPIVPGANGRDPHEKHVKVDYNPHTEFHTYAFEWTPTYIAWFVDGKEVYRDDSDYIKKMNRPQKIMMNIWPAIWDGWVGPVDDSKFPIHAIYDWVAYYDYTPNKKEKFSLRWKDDFDEIDPTRWQFATHTFDGNLCVFTPENGKIKDGRLYLTLSKVADKASETNKKKTYGPRSSEVEIVEATYKKGKIKLAYSDEVDRTTAIDPANYTIEGEVGIKKIKFNYDFKSVTIVLQDPKSFDNDVPSIEVKGVKDKTYEGAVINGKIAVKKED